MRRITNDNITKFCDYLVNEEKANATIEKYIRDVKAFVEWLGGRKLDKYAVLTYKNELSERYTVSSANSMIAAINAFFKFLGLDDLCVKQFKVQKKIFCSQDRELSKNEYFSLIKTAESRNNLRLSLVIQTICCTGIRISELPHITVEAVRRGEAIVTCKGKSRTVFIITKLQKKLLKYIRQQKIKAGSIFVSKNGNPLNRSNIWSEMKKLCEDAGVLASKVFPHNLRHLFARMFYSIEKDIAKLADILGHSSINTTRIYIIATGEEHRRKMENMRLII